MIYEMGPDGLRCLGIEVYFAYMLSPMYEMHFASQVINSIRGNPQRGVRCIYGNNTVSMPKCVNNNA